MVGRVFATVVRIENAQGASMDVIKDVQIAFWMGTFQYRERFVTLLEMQSQDREALWEALESVVERDPRFAWVREYPGIKSLLERRRRNEEAKSFLTF